MTVGLSAGWARWVVLLSMLAWAACATAQVAVPRLAGEVNDLTGSLSVEQQSELSQTLRAFSTRKGTQFAVLLLPTTGAEPIESFALRVAEEWKIGRKGVDDGALLVIAKNDRALRVEVGYGLEGVLGDAVARRVIDEVIVPRLQSGDFYGGIKAGVEQMIRIADGEPLPAPATSVVSSNGGGLGQFAPILFIVALGLGGPLRRALGKLPGALVSGGAIAIIAWFMVGSLVVALIAGVIAAVVSLMGLGAGQPGSGRYYSGAGRGFPIGGMGGGFPGGGGFGSGGGFSGGGGGFGGGGASGRW